MDFTAHWHWPQWAIVALLFLGFVFSSTMHGKPRVQTTGDEKGQPERYNAFAAMSRVTLWVFILICGGFFK